MRKVLALVVAVFFTLAGAVILPASGGRLTVAAPAASSSNFDVSFSTKAGAGAGVLNTLTCPADSVALGGGCDCSGISLPTGNINRFSDTAADTMPTGWSCQVPTVAGTGGDCAVFLTCSKIGL